MAFGKKQEPGAVKQKSRMGLLLLALLILMTVATAFLGWRYFASSRSPAAAVQAQQKASGTPEAASGGKGNQKGDGGGNGIINFEPFLVNLADTGAYRYLRVTIRVAVTNKEKAEHIATTDVSVSKIRDSILNTLSSKVADEIITPEGKVKLKTEIKEDLNSFLPDKPVVDIFFTEFVVQL